MTTISKSFSWLYACFGLFCGFIIGASLDKGISLFAMKIMPVGIVIALVVFSRRIESAAHRQHVETWPTWRTRGKWKFIIVNYVVIRATILFLAVAAPAIPVLEFTRYAVSILLASVVALEFLMIYLGHEEWTRCEEDYQIQMFRQAAEQSRIAGN